MASGQRAFVQKLNKQANADVRRQVASGAVSKETSRGVPTAQGNAWWEVVDPPDFEELLEQQHLFQMCDSAGDQPPHTLQQVAPCYSPGDVQQWLIQFPVDDLEVGVLPRERRTLEPLLPDEDISELSWSVRQCLQCTTSDWVAARCRYGALAMGQASHTQAAATAALLRSSPLEFELDLEQGDLDQSSTSLTSGGSDSLRGSWASSEWDLRQCEADSLLSSLVQQLQGKAAPSTVQPSWIPQRGDEVGEDEEVEKGERPPALFALCPPLAPQDPPLERRAPPDVPREQTPHRLLVRCLALKLELEIEPIFGSMALYDAKERKKVSENFYFDMNSEPLKRMLTGHVPYQDISTLSRACIFNISNPSTDLFLVVRLEKVLQGDMNECAEPYMKDERNREKVRSSAVAACERLGRYRQPFAWTAISLLNVVAGIGSLEREASASSDGSSGSSTGTLGRRGSVERRSGSEKRNSWSLEDFSTALDTFRPVTLTVNSFFKQEAERLREEDLFKFLADLKRPSSALKRLKCIPGALRLDISPCQEEVRYSLSPELARLNPYPDEKGRPTKELLEFPSREPLRPHYNFRNLLYLYPRSLNFANRPGSARNIACRVQLLCGEHPDTYSLPALFGKSSCPEVVTEVYTAVTYHNKSPDYQDEIKIKLPAKLTDRHHLFFTFYHISCQRKMEHTPTETPIGYTWLPLFHEGRLRSGEQSLQVLQDPPPTGYSFLSPSVHLPNARWVDGHRPLFEITLLSQSSIFPQDPHIEQFLEICGALEEGGRLPTSSGADPEAELRSRALALELSAPGPLMGFLPPLLESLLRLLAQPPWPCASRDAFHATAALVHRVSTLLSDEEDQHGRNALLASWIHFQCALPPATELYPALGSPTAECSTATLGRLPSSNTTVRWTMGRSSSQPDLVTASLLEESEVQQQHVGASPHSGGRPLDRTASMRPQGCMAAGGQPMVQGPGTWRRPLHEELLLQWVVSSGPSRDLALAHSWFFLELVVHAATLHLAATGRLHAPRTTRFSQRFADDIVTLVGSLTTEVVARSCTDTPESRPLQQLNASLSFFLRDLLSIMDRGFVFQLIKSYCQQVGAAVCALPSTVCESATLLSCLKLDLLRVVCSHEHFVALNLALVIPPRPPSIALEGPCSPPASPCPSVASSQSSGGAGGTPSTSGGVASWLCSEFRQQHFLLGLVLSDLASALHSCVGSVQSKGVWVVRSLLAWHEGDPRLLQGLLPRVASLYLPLITLVVDALPLLHGWTPTTGCGHNGELDRQDSSAIQQSVAQAISGSTVRNSLHPEPAEGAHAHGRQSQMKEEATRNLLLCLVWVLKHTEAPLLKGVWSQWGPQRLLGLLDALHLCIDAFQYKGKRILRRYDQHTLRKTSVIKSQLEDAILGHNSARSEMIRRKGAATGMGSAPGSAERTVAGSSQTSAQGEQQRLRWRKDQTQWNRNFGDSSDRSKIEKEAHTEGHLATEVTTVILNTLDLMVQVCSGSEQHQGALGGVLRVLLHSLDRHQSTQALQGLFAAQRALVAKFPELLFEEEAEQCGDLCLLLLRHCSSRLSVVRSQAAASLYLLMRHNFEMGNNFSRVKMQVTMSLSSLVGRSQVCNEDCLRRALKTVLLYAEQDLDLRDTTFPEQVQDLVFNLHMILCDTVKMKEFQEDPEMLLDLMFRIAKGYQNSPDLRLTWLANMAQKHTQRGQHAEAALCLVHSAALVAEYLHMLEDRPHLPIGCVAFQRISENVLEESAVSDDVLSPDEEGTCSGKYFSENGLVGLLEQAANCFTLAGLYEATNEVYKVLIPIAEAQRDYKKLANIHSKLYQVFAKIDQQSGKRVFGTYFRVSFYGAKFGDLDSEEFVYKEPTLTKLPEISHRLENFYSERFGSEFVEIIKDSNMVDVSRLHPEKAYIQITYVEPYFDMYELQERVTSFEKNYNIKRFIYATPFTLDGRAHGELHEQYKRKTIVTTANAFPYIKTRIQVVERQQVVLTPIEVAIEDIQKKTAELAQATQQEPSDPKILQMVLQGCIGTTVNQGPAEVAKVFLLDLAHGTKAPTQLQNRLRLSFKDFCRKCNDALRKNKALIGADQRDYQKELDRNYHSLTQRLQPMIRNNGFPPLSISYT
ncbi:dedicator of cytokinesis protein 6-like [Ornithodoros turicata]|uniref:dedicator of cytokinesis protein 6-like n=1 Tax=Ornithodoros turicata TaxID=34597 RepID=UPI00313994B0